MTRDWILLAPIALGHLGNFVVITNVGHALGLAEVWANRIKLAVVASFLAVSGWVAYWASQGGWETWPWPVRAYAFLCLAIAVVGIPATSLLRALRRPPEAVSGRASEIDFTEKHGRDALIGEGRHAWALRLPGNESLRLRVCEWDLAMPALPPAWDGLSVLHLTDLHFAPCFRRRFFEQVIEEAGAWEPDLVLLTGDLVDHDDAIDWVAPILSRLRARLGMFSILGNHDYDHDHVRVQEQLEEAGFVDLEGRWTRLDIEGRTLALGGTSAPWGPRLDLRAEADADFRLLMSHSPDLFYRAVDSGIDLMLSGHNHGGQVRLPLIGPVFMPSVYSRHFDRGFFQSRRTLLHVSQGVAGKHPVRYGCVPEIGRFVLRRPRGFASPHAARPVSAVQEV